MSVFSTRLKELRNKSNLSQQELSKIIGVSKSSINMYERGEREPGLETIRAFADYFDVQTDYLLGKHDDKRSLKNGKEKKMNYGIMAGASCTTLTPDEAVEIIRRAGVKIGTETLRDGIEQGVFPFGILIMQNKRVFLISRKKLGEWLEDFCGVALCELCREGA